MKRRALRLLSVCLLFVLLFSGCKKKQEDSDNGTLYQFDYRNTDLSQYGSLSDSAYRSLSITLSADARFRGEASVDAYLKVLFENNPVVSRVTDRPVAWGDTIVVYYKAYDEAGNPLYAVESTESEPRDGLRVTLGESEEKPGTDGLNVPGFNRKIVGAEPGAAAILSLDVPDDYGIVELRGKTVTFHVMVSYIRVEDKPTALSASYIRDTLKWEGELTGEESDEEVVRAFRTYLYDYLKIQMTTSHDKARNTAILAQLTEAYRLVSLPQGDLRYQFGKLYTRFESYRRSVNAQAGREVYPDVAAAVSDYYQLSEDEDAMDYLSLLAGREVLNNLVVATIFRQEGLTISDAEFEERKQELLAADGDTAADEGRTIDVNYVYNDLIWEKTMNFLSDPARCRITYSEN